MAIIFKMTLSFVIPAYNEERFIGKCLDSIIEETRERHYKTEIIVVNNASTDRTKEIAKRRKNVIVIDEPKKGIVYARLKGIKKSTGDLIANIDADTMIPKGWLDEVIYEFSKNPNLVCLSGPHIYYDAPKTIRTLSKIFYYFGYILYIINKFVLRIGSIVQGGNFIVRKDAILKAGEPNKNVNFYGEDSDIAKRLYKLGDVKFTFKLPIYASWRRLEKEGILKTAAKYAINYFWIMLFGKPYTNTYKDIRPKA